MTLIAKKHLYNPAEYGSASPGEVFIAADHIAKELLKRGYAIPLYETKVVVAGAPLTYEVKEGAAATAPFCDVPDSDPEPPALAALRAAVRAIPDAPTEGDSRPVERRKRGRPRKQR